MRRHDRLGGLILGLLLAALPGTAAGQATEQAATGMDEAPAALLGPHRPPLEGTTWRLTHYRSGDLREVGPEIAAWMTLRNGKVRGSSGCAALAGTYARMGPLVAFAGRGTQGDADCTEQEALVQGGMLRGTRSATTVTIAPADSEPGASGPDARLSLRARDGTELLRFAVDDAASLSGAEWRLSTYTIDGETTTAVVAQAAVFAFDRDERDEVRRRSSGTLIGSSGCNGIVTDYSRSADVLSFAGLERTDAPCSPALAAQEAAIVEVLEAGALWLDLPPDRLTLASVDSGDRLDLVSSDPLEGTTWLLTRLRGSGSISQPVTLRLEDGRLGGEGPCGTYGGVYATDGIFITFSQLAGSDPSGCDLRDRQAELLRALRDAVLLERPNGQLRLVDVFGRTLARFKRPGGP